jgi:hypothetical protein
MWKRHRGRQWRGNEDVLDVLSGEKLGQNFESP